MNDIRQRASSHAARHLGGLLDRTGDGRPRLACLLAAVALAVWPRGASAACERQGLEVLAVERHASRGRDVRPFVVARKPMQAGAEPAGSVAR